jgi:hypothetical protein
VRAVELADHASPTGLFLIGVDLVAPRQPEDAIAGLSLSYPQPVRDDVAQKAVETVVLWEASYVLAGNRRWTHGRVATLESSG